MGWSVLGTQFCLELAFGVLVALAFVHRAPLGVFFFRLMGTTAVLPILVAIVMPVTSGLAEWTDPVPLAASLAVLSYPFYTGPVKAARRLIALGVAIAGSGAALVLVVSEAQRVEGGLGNAVASVSALATGCVAGTVGLAMVLGHWYLTIPNLHVAHLRRMNQVTVGSMVLCLVSVGLSYAIFFAGEPLGSPYELGMWGLFYLGTRVAVGLALPLVFAWMTSQSLRYENTRSATGILYASTVLVLIGTAVSISLQDSYGVPL
jgi:hypothetical protein